MNDQLTAIHTELLMMKEELQSRLFEYSCFQMSASVEPSMNDQEATLIYHIKEELQDVLLALSKFENNTYGYCEKQAPPFRLKNLRCR